MLSMLESETADKNFDCICLQKELDFSGQLCIVLALTNSGTSLQLPILKYCMRWVSSYLPTSLSAVLFPPLYFLFTHPKSKEHKLSYRASHHHPNLSKRFGYLPAIVFLPALSLWHLRRYYKFSKGQEHTCNKMININRKSKRNTSTSTWSGFHSLEGLLLEYRIQYSMLSS